MKKELRLRLNHIRALVAQSQAVILELEFTRDYIDSVIAIYKKGQDDLNKESKKILKEMSGK